MLLIDRELYFCIQKIMKARSPPIHSIINSILVFLDIHILFTIPSYFAFSSMPTPPDLSDIFIHVKYSPILLAYWQISDSIYILISSMPFSPSASAGVHHHIVCKTIFHWGSYDKVVACNICERLHHSRHIL